MTKAVRWTLWGAMLSIALFLALLPVMKATAEQIEVRTAILRERWDATRLAWLDAWRMAFTTSWRLLVLLLALGPARRALPPVIKRWRNRPRWVRATLRKKVKPRRQRLTRSDSMEL